MSQTPGAAPAPTPAEDPTGAAAAAATVLAERTGVARHDVALVLGSGWLPATDLPGFAPPGVAGHAGTVRSVELAGGGRALVFAGRTHFYEDRGVEAVVHGVRTAAAAGCRIIVLTNGCGGLRPEWAPGTPVLISDHINLTGASPLRGATFIDMTEVYSPRLRALCRQLDPTLAEGVYVQFRGPQYETPAEVRMARVLGGDLVGMSTTLEAIAAREAGLEILGLSLVTNFGAGMSGQPLNHAEVLEAGAAAAERMGTLLAEVVGRISAAEAATATVSPESPPAGSGAGPQAAGLTEPEDAALADRVRAWVAEDPDPATAAELSGLLAAAEGGDPDARADLADAFAGTLEFGTAGLRGRLGGGPNRMNRVVVTRAAAGLARYLLDNGRAGTPVVVGYDARHNSDVFAQDTVAVMAGAGLRPLLMPRPLPTPVLAAAVRILGASAGVMVTASHNPPEDNGYKVYLGDGSQIVPPADSEIAARIVAVGALADVPRGRQVEVLDEAIVDDYLDRVASLPLPGGPRELSIAYTALHGVGSLLMRAALVRAGFAEPTVVGEQDEPDPEFPTVAFPNPEEPGAMDLALALAEQESVDLVLANDPDADRCAVALPTRSGSFRMLTGDEVGVLLGWWILERGRRAGTPVAGTFANSIVSSQQLGALARAAGVSFRETLTGFKWIARAADDLAFGYEEALGYCVDPTGVRDKDGISAGLLVAEVAAALKAEGRTILDVLDDLAAAHGVFATGQVSLRFADLDRIPALMAALRAEPPAQLGGLPVAELVDLTEGSAQLPPTDGLRFTLGGAGAVRSARVIIRPSGTEPKVKAYLEVQVPVSQGPAANSDEVAAARAAANAQLTGLAADVRTRLQALG